MLVLTALWGFQQVTVKWIAADVSLVMQAAIRSMYNLDDIAQMLARQGVAPRFDLPAAAPPRLLSRAEAGATLDRRETAIHEALSGIQADSIESPRAERHRRIVVAQFAQMRNLVNGAAFSA